MGQWTLIYDMFWSAYGGNVEWLYVRPEHRGSGVVAAIVAEILRGSLLGTSFAVCRIPG